MATVSGLSTWLPLPRALVEDHLAEPDVVARGAVEAAAAHVEFRILLELERKRRQHAVGPAPMHADQPLALLVADLEAGVGHAERREDVVAQIGIEPLAGDRLDRLADEIDVDAVFPACAGVGHDRGLQRVVLAGDDAGRAGLLHVLAHVGVPHVVAEAGGVGHEVAQRDRLRRRAQLRLAVVVEALEHLGRGEVRQQFADRLVERELALFDQLHRARGRDRLGHRGDPEHAVGGHRIVLAEVALAERALVDHLLGGGRHRDHAGNLPGVALLAENLVDIRLVLHGWLPPVCFFECRDLPPAESTGQAGPSGRGGARDLVIGAEGQQKMRGKWRKMAAVPRICGEIMPLSRGRQRHRRYAVLHGPFRLYLQ